MRLCSQGDGEADDGDDEFTLVRQITSARTRILSVLAEPGSMGMSDPLKIKERSLKTMGTLAAVTTSVSNDLSGNFKKAGLDFGGVARRVTGIRRMFS